MKNRENIGIRLAFFFLEKWLIFCRLHKKEWRKRSVHLAVSQAVYFFSPACMRQHFPLAKYLAHKTPRVQKVIEYLSTLSFPKRKYEDCCASIHSFRVALEAETESEVIISLLHDVLEDFGCEEIFYFLDFCTKEEIKDILLLSHFSRTPREVYIEQIKGNERARKIKIWDIEDNLPTSPKQKKYQYEKELEVLRGERYE